MKTDLAWLTTSLLAALGCSSPERDFGPDDESGGRGGAPAGSGGASGAAGSVAGGAAGQAGSDTRPSCEPGFYDCNQQPDDGCEASDVPRLMPPTALEPLRGAYTGSLHAPTAMSTLRPTLAYSTAAELCGPVRYEIELDDSCTPGALDGCAFDSPELQASSTTGTLELLEDLPVSTTPPVGALYAWRVRACDASQRCSEWSRPAHLHVGRTEQDLNGDGYADVLAESGVGVEAYFGAENFDGRADARLPEMLYTRFVGDLDSDGFADVAGGVNGFEECSASGYVVQVVYGGAAPVAPRTQILCRTAGSPSVVTVPSDLGDLNGDGFDDLGVAWGFGETENSLLIFAGGDRVSAEPLTEADAVAPGIPYTLTLGSVQQTQGRGDYNADGYSDVMAAGWGQPDTPARFHVLLGAPTLTPAFDVTLRDPSCLSVRWFTHAGDVDADGKSDWAVVCSGATAAETRFGLVLGGSNNSGSLQRTWTTSIKLTTTTPWLDFDNDGQPEFLLGVLDDAAVIWQPGISDPVVPARYSRYRLAELVDTADHNGDGRLDVVFGNAQRSIQRVGSTSSFSVVPTTLAPASDVTGRFQLVP